jgi:tagaturonate epimerase
LQAQAVFEGLHHSVDGVQYFPVTPHNAACLRQRLPWLNLAPLGLALSFGFGDRLGLATPGHVRSLAGTGFAPVFAQQSVRENARTGRTPQQVLDDAMWGVFQEGWRRPWGADADHLKQVSDLAPFVQAGYSFFTVDPGEHVEVSADSDGIETLRGKAAALPWEALLSTPAELHRAYLDRPLVVGGMSLACDETTLLRAAAKYGQAIAHIDRMYRALLALKPGGFDFEVSIDETGAPTRVFEHYFIVRELKRLGIRWTSLAPRLPGRFEKGVDYIGDLEQLKAELARHAAVVQASGGYKLSLHSGSDKFSVYPLLARSAGEQVHIKTAGTSYLEALRVIACLDPDLFRRLLAMAKERYPQERFSYHVSADENCLPDEAAAAGLDLPELLEDFHIREALHVTYGSALAQYEPQIKHLLRTNPEVYAAGLLRHFRRHLEPFQEVYSHGNAG